MPKASKRQLVSVLLVLAATAGLVVGTYVAGMRPVLGLDLRGGLSVTLTAPEGTRADLMDKAVETLRGRVDSAGVAEPEITREGSNNIFIQLPGTKDPERLLSLIGRTAQLQFRGVQEMILKDTEAEKFEATPVDDSDDRDRELVLLSDDGKTKYKLSKAELTGSEVRKGTARPDPETSGASWQVLLDFKKEGSEKWKEFTGRLACLQGPQRQIAIVLDGRVESAPQVATDIKCNEGIAGGGTNITGGFDEDESKDLAVVLTAGALPVKLQQSEVRSVSPTLGQDSLRAGILAGALGLLLVMLYVLVYYRTLGLQTWAGLLVFAAALYGLIVLFGELIGWSLTLAGIAGIIVSIGVATDSYIVFFERVKEEVHAGRSISASIDRGFKHAWRTMRTANAVTILAAIVLYFLAVGPVRGFALALGVATILDLLITYALTWPMAAILARSRFFAENPILGMRRALEGGEKEGSLLRKIYRSEFNIDFVGKRKLWFSISGVMIALSAIFLLPSVKGLTYGIDFKGGAIYRAPISDSVSVSDVRNALEDTGIDQPVIQVVRDQVSKRAQVQVQTEATVGNEQRSKVIESLAKVAKVDPSRVDTEAVGEKWGAQITTKALRGLAIFLVLVFLYMSWRLELKMAGAGMGALLHDLIITAGVYALVGFEVTPATVIATLTILGYSLYDTVVVFDKIRENQSMAGNQRKTFKQIANESTNQVLMRSINTSLTVIFPVGSLLVVGSSVLGGETLKDLALALFVGLTASTYSSIFVAIPLLSVWKEREGRYVNVKNRLLAEARSSAALNGESKTDAMVSAQIASDAGAAGGVRGGSVAPNGDEPGAEPANPPEENRRPRQQPRRQSRAKRKKSR